MMPTEVSTKISYEEFRELPDDGKRYELICGEVHVSPSPNTWHQIALWVLSTSLGAFTATNRLGRVLFAPLDVRLGRDTALQPDLIFISNAQAHLIEKNFIAGAPDLVVEVLSPSTATYDRATKLALYAESGVSEVWLIDPQAATAEVLRLQGKKYFVEAALGGDQVLASTLFPGWELPLNELFDFRSS